MAKRIYTVSYLPIAENDLAEILTFVKQRNAAAAQKLYMAMKDRIAMLALHPELGVIPKDETIQKTGHRVLIVDKYLIFYVITGDRVEIRRILHGAQDLTDLLF